VNGDVPHVDDLASVGRPERSLSAGSLATSDPVWGTAGIAYFTTSGIMLLDPTSGQSRLMSSEYVNGVLAWSPGRVLAVAEPTQIVLLKASGAVLGDLPDPPTSRPVCGLAWSRSGKEILLSTRKNGTRLAQLWVGTVRTKRWHELPAPPLWRNDGYDCAVSSR